MPIKLAIGLPTYPGHIAPGHATMWLTMGGALKAYVEYFTLKGVITIDACGIAMVRNYILAQAMMLDADWLLMVDADTWVDQGAELLRMIEEAHKRGATIIGAPIYRRDGENLAIYRVVDGKAISIKREEMPVNVFGVDAIGAACMAINLRKIGDSTFVFTDENSEDLEFCRQIREIEKGTILVDPRVKTNHTKKADVAIYTPDKVPA